MKRNLAISVQGCRQNYDLPPLQVTRAYLRPRTHVAHVVRRAYHRRTHGWIGRERENREQNMSAIWGLCSPMGKEYLVHTGYLPWQRNPGRPDTVQIPWKYIRQDADRDAEGGRRG